jgi:D-alanyl-D-alanine carboxypeptidase (penicillin-binding protein 5/6)
MTLLLAFEALDAGTIQLSDPVVASAHAASMGGSQVWLKEGETLTVEELIKCIAVVSANDCSVAMAEHLAGSEEAFAQQMNARAAELGMQDTHFVNCTGLPAEGHLTSAWDIALMSNALLQHEDVQKYTLIWQDSIRNGASVLTNTNRLVHDYPGTTGLKTGSTDAAGWCLSASATRDGLALVAVVMKANNRDARNADARRLLDYGFANYASVSLTPDTPILPVEVLLGTPSRITCDLASDTPQVYEKAKLAQVEKEILLDAPLTAPVAEGQPVGQMIVRAGEEVIARIPIVAQMASDRQSVWDIFVRIMGTAGCRTGLNP